MQTMGRDSIDLRQHHQGDDWARHRQCNRQDKHGRVVAKKCVDHDHPITLDTISVTSEVVSSRSIRILMSAVICRTMTHVTDMLDEGTEPLGTFLYLGRRQVTARQPKFVAARVAQIEMHHWRPENAELTCR